MRHLAFLATVVAALCPLAIAEEPPASNDDALEVDWGKADGKVNDIGLQSDYLELATVTDATAEQQTILKTDQDAREQALRQWDQKNENKIKRYEVAINRARTDAQKKRYEKGLERLMTERSELAAQHLAKSVKSLKPDQQKVWYGHQLFKAVEPRFTDLGVKLNDEQVKQAKAICTKIARKTRRNPAESERFKAAAFKEIGREVLTDIQRRTAAATVRARQEREKQRKDDEEEEEEEEEEEDDRRRRDHL
ncbi:MAG: hypothetical protein GVY16_12175 [Planctomycetes bacterium]|jgi:hypothetical protein|nr:hypothetical protein [Phycisphaerae bacterium]NBB96479.1 hypothetical protein [Planctomycetota bacterium]